ncbi:MAG: 2-dehydropantoate 2-reductase [Elusimicrobiota bacterium]
MKIVIVGPGAMGCLFAGLLSKNPKNEVWLLDKNPERTAVIKKNGIKISGLTKKNTKTKITTEPNEIGTANLVLIFVKSYDTESATKSVLPCINKETIILSLQNGLGNIEIIRKYSVNNVFAGITAIGATLIGWGKVKHAGKGATIIGKSGRAKEIIKAFNKTGIVIKANNNIDSIIWSKLVLNSAINPLGAITQMKNGELIENCYIKDSLIQTVKETAMIAKDLGIKLLYKNPEKEVVNACKKTKNNTNSMLQDILNRKQTEIEYINGAIIKQAEKLKLEAPLNKNLYSRVKSIEKKP